MTDVVSAVRSEELPASAPEDDASPARRRALPGVGVTLSAAWLVGIVLAALLADLLPLPDPDFDSGHGFRTRPFTDWSVPLGTDSYGRDLLARVVYGARISLAAGVGSVTLALTVGMALGTTAGFLRSWFDWTTGVVIDAILAVPALVLLIALASTLQPGMSTVILGLSLIAFPTFSRLARANTLRYASAEFVLAARGLGAKTSTVLIRELVPNVIRDVAAFAGVVCAVLILAESSLSFLGLGVPPPSPSWGNMIAEGRQFLGSDPHLVFVPMAALFATIWSLNTVGDWLRQRSSSRSMP